MNKKEFGKELQKYREEAGYSQEKLAEKIDRSSIFISYMERGTKSPSIETLISLANILDVSVDLLLGNEIHANNMSKLSHLADKMLPLPAVTQKKLLDIFDSIIATELEYMNDSGENK